jgi:hypothetical protein
MDMRPESLGSHTGEVGILRAPLEIEERLWEERKRGRGWPKFWDKHWDRKDPALECNPQLCHQHHDLEQVITISVS